MAGSQMELLCPASLPAGEHLPGLVQPQLLPLELFVHHRYSHGHPELPTRQGAQAPPVGRPLDIF